MHNYMRHGTRIQYTHTALHVLTHVGADLRGCAHTGRYSPLVLTQVLRLDSQQRVLLFFFYGGGWRWFAAMTSSYLGCECGPGGIGACAGGVAGFLDELPVDLS